MTIDAWVSGHNKRLLDLAEEERKITERKLPWWQWLEEFGRNIWWETPLSPEYYLPQEKKREKWYKEWGRQQGFGIEPTERSGPLEMRAYEPQKGRTRVPLETPYSGFGYTGGISPAERATGEWLLTGAATGWIPMPSIGKGIQLVGKALRGPLSKQVAAQAAKQPTKQVATALRPKGPIQATDTARDKLLKAIEITKATRRQLGPKRKAELARRAREADQALKTIEDPEKAFAIAKSKLRGILPSAELRRGLFTEADGIELVNVIKQSQLGLFEKIRARDALTQLIARGEMIQPNQIKLLGRVFGDDVARALTGSRRSLPEKVWNISMDILNLPRAIQASIDNSFFLRQGAPMIPRHPLLAAKSFVSSLKAPWTDRLLRNVMTTVESRPNTAFGREMGLEIVEWPVKGSRVLSKMEEAYMTRLARWIPGIKQSERAFIAGSNDLRSRVWEHHCKILEKLGATEVDYRGVARFINAATGRGPLPRALRGASPLLNAMFFSPRYQLAKIDLPVLLLHSSSYVRKEAARTLVQFLAAGTSLLTLLSMATGATVETDPRSTDFGKLRIGNTRLDIWAGYVQYMRFISQILSGTRRTAGGRKQKLNRREIVLRFVQSKLSPATGLMNDILAGQTYIGEEMTLEKEALQMQVRRRLTPFFVQDMWDALEEEGILGGFVTAPGFLGVGAVSYPPNVRRGRRKIRTK